MENVRNQLLERGVVYTLRDHPHREGRDWVQIRRGTPKIADVIVTRVDSNPMFHVGESGFPTLLDWEYAYAKLNKNDKHMRKAILYRVELVSHALDNKVADESFGIRPVREGTTTMVFKKIDADSCLNCYYRRFGFLSYDDSPHEYTCRFLSADDPDNVRTRALYLVDTDRVGWEGELRKMRCKNWREAAEK